MIIVETGGGLGNQLFKYAVGRCLSLKHKSELKLYAKSFKDNTTNHHDYYKLGAFNIKETFATIEEVRSLQKVTEKELWKFYPEIMNLPDNTFLFGTWQSEKYFIEIEDIIRREFTLKAPLSNTARGCW